jgi:hypothetical protein
MSTEMKPDFIIQNECGVYFSSMHPIKKLVYKIHSFFMICGHKSLCTTVVLHEYKQRFNAFPADGAGRPICHASWAGDFLWDLSTLAQVLSSFPQHMSSAYSLTV